MPVLPPRPRKRESVIARREREAHRRQRTGLAFAKTFNPDYFSMLTPEAAGSLANTQVAITPADIRGGFNVGSRTLSLHPKNLWPLGGAEHEYTHAIDPEERNTITQALLSLAEWAGIRPGFSGRLTRQERQGIKEFYGVPRDNLQESLMFARGREYFPTLFQQHGYNVANLPLHVQDYYRRFFRPRGRASELQPSYQPWMAPQP